MALLAGGLDQPGPALHAGGGLGGLELAARIDHRLDEGDAQLHQGREQLVEEAELGRQRQAGLEGEGGLPVLVQGRHEAGHTAGPVQLGEVGLPGLVPQHHLEGVPGLEAQGPEVPDGLDSQRHRGVFGGREGGREGGEEEAGEAHPSMIPRGLPSFDKLEALEEPWSMHCSKPRPGGPG